MKIKEKNSNCNKKALRIKKLTVMLSLYCWLITLAYSETITFSANAMSGTVNDNNDYTKLTGNAFVKTDSIELRANEIEMNGEDYRYIVASGSISGTYSEAGFTFECDSIRYDREEEIAILEGGVTMIDTENDVTLKAEFVEYNQNTEIALIQIDVEILQDESVCTAAFALYRKSLQVLELSGSPKITQGDDIFQAHEVVFNLDTEEITLIGKVKGTVTESSDEESEDENSPTLEAETN